MFRLLNPPALSLAIRLHFVEKDSAPPRSRSLYPRFRESGRKPGLRAMFGGRRKLAVWNRESAKVAAARCRNLLRLWDPSGIPFQEFCAQPSVVAGPPVS